MIEQNTYLLDRLTQAWTLDLSSQIQKLKSERAQEPLTLISVKDEGEVITKVLPGNMLEKLSQIPGLESEVERLSNKQKELQSRLYEILKAYDKFEETMMGFE